MAVSQWKSLVHTLYGLNSTDLVISYQGCLAFRPQAPQSSFHRKERGSVSSTLSRFLDISMVWTESAQWFYKNGQARASWFNMLTSVDVSATQYKDISDVML